MNKKCERGIRRTFKSWGLVELEDYLEVKTPLRTFQLDFIDGFCDSILIDINFETGKFQIIMFERKFIKRTPLPSQVKILSKGEAANSDEFYSYLIETEIIDIIHKYYDISRRFRKFISYSVETKGKQLWVCSTN